LNKLKINIIIMRFHFKAAVVLLFFLIFATIYTIKLNYIQYRTGMNILTMIESLNYDDS